MDGDHGMGGDQQGQNGGSQSGQYQSQSFGADGNA